MHVENYPERSYWEGEWRLPGLGCLVGIYLRGGEDGPGEDARSFYLKLPERMEQILQRCRPPLASVFRQWLSRDLPEDMFSEVKLTGFGVDDPNGHPLLWNVSFETTGEKWLGIEIPFVDDVAGEAQVDT